MKFQNIFLFIAIACASCAAQKASTITGGEYDERKNQTDYFVLPYGSVSLPGKWIKTKFNNVSNQQFFKNADSVTIAIAFTPVDKYEFNTSNEKKGFEFVKAFYEWDAQYFIHTHKLQQETIESSENQHYIIWHLFGESNNVAYDTYFLFGEKNDQARNFSIMKTDKWSSDEKIKFLKEIFLER